jgi:hypothetical protein
MYVCMYVCMYACMYVGEQEVNTVRTSIIESNQFITLHMVMARH